MKKFQSKILYSATDLVNFTQCEHRTTMDMMHLETPMEKAADSEEMEFIQNRGYDHEHDYVKRLKAAAKSVIEVNTGGHGDDISVLDAAVAATTDAMKQGVDVIYQAVLRNDIYYGYVDFLRRVDVPPRPGRHRYEAVDTKLARTVKPAYIIQLCFYSDLLGRAQDQDPEMFGLVLGDKREECFRYDDFSKYYASIKARFEKKVCLNDRNTRSEPCELCEKCVWREICADQWRKEDHLCQVANITRIQINKLADAGITTLADLAALPEDHKSPGINPETLNKIRHQAALQFQKRTTGRDIHEILPPDPEAVRGFARLPLPDDGDLYFDMEGDPLEPGGLEYLFGVYYKSGDDYTFKPFWGHDRAGEKKAFEGFMDFVAAHLNTHPNAHIYHYASYEESALKRLMCLHGTREADVDNLLRKQKLVDLYKVVKEAIRVSEPSYSIKNLEVFYMPGARDGDVKTAMGSVICYEKWRQDKDESLLREIAAYNEDDCRSTYLLHHWLLSLRPADTPWFQPEEKASGQLAEDTLTEAEKLLIPYRVTLMDPLPENREKWTRQQALDELVYFLLDFHRREDKPGYWALFTRAEMTDEDALDDPECLGALKMDKNHPPVPDKRSYIYTYTIPEQDSKIKTGDRCCRLGVTSMDPVNQLEIDEQYTTLSFRYAMKRPPLPKVISLGPTGPINSQKLKDAVRRFADSHIAGDQRYKAVSDLLQRKPPDIKGVKQRDPIIRESGPKSLPLIIDAVARLNQSCISIQGPPGSGKTFTGGHIIVDLLKNGYRVGVTSNSHKAIHNLLYKVEEIAGQTGFSFSGAKKATASNDDSFFNGRFIRDYEKSDDIIGRGFQLVAGTAWLFSEEGLDTSLDYLIVDEAGQVSLGNLCAMGTAAKNIVLLGDQMQLGQPIQGLHPGDSGLSSLDYLLQGRATIPPDMGIFLATSWRMHPDVCAFISDAVYDSRLLPEPENKHQRIMLKSNPHPALKSSGIVYLPTDHDGCSQASEEEAAAIAELYASLLAQTRTDKSGKKHNMSEEDILVVAPYNMQVNLLKRRLPPAARVGTVDKFQGQEAAVVMVSMATSSHEFLPRYMDFLYSKNRLNVALSRAQCLSILVANPRLMTVQCRTVDQMKLVNTLCWVKEYAAGTNACVRAGVAIST